MYKIKGGYRNSGTRDFALFTFLIIANPFNYTEDTMVHLSSVVILALTCCCLVMYTTAEDDSSLSQENGPTLFDYGATEIKGSEEGGATLNRQKRTLFLKKKLIGAGLLGLGLGLAKGYKAGYYSAPEVHHVYLSPPPASTKYVEYIEKPVFYERIIERPAPVYKPVHVEYRESSPYGSW